MRTTVERVARAGFDASIASTACIRVVLPEPDEPIIRMLPAPSPASFLARATDISRTASVWPTTRRESHSAICRGRRVEGHVRDCIPPRAGASRLIESAPASHVRRQRRRRPSEAAEDLTARSRSRASARPTATRSRGDVSLDVQPGEFLTLLGPSGCGKTTLLRLLAGFEVPDAGAILISGRDVAALPPYERPVNTVFQHYALFPHRTVAGNVAFGLEMAGPAAAPRSPSGSTRALEMVRLAGLRRAPHRPALRRPEAAGGPGPRRRSWSPRCCSSTSPWPPST